MDLKWIREQLDRTRTSQAQLAVAIGLTPVQMNKVLSGYRMLKADEADAIRRFFGFSLPEDYPRTVRVVGKMNAIDEVSLVPGYRSGACLYTIERPEWVPPRGIVGLEIGNSSAEPWALAGDVVFWRATDEDVSQADLGRPVIAQVRDGSIVLKRLASGSRPGHWSLLSLNPTHANMMDVRLLWASRIVASIARDQVRIADPA